MPAGPCTAFLIAALLLAAGEGLGQTVVTPATPTEFNKREINGGSNAGVGIVSERARPPKTITIQFTAVTPVRVWTNKEGRAMEARLLAWSAPKEGEKGPVEVIRDGRIRFLLSQTSKPVEYELAKLSTTDRTYVEKIADAARHEEPAEVRTKTEPVEKKKE